MSYRQSNSSCRDAGLVSQSRLSQQIRRDSTDEGCPVIEESGTVCGETNSLSIFQEFRQMYDDCLKKLEGSVNGNATLKKLAPFKKLIDDLWEQNTMLVETVEELEQEATYRVTNLQDRLNKSCQKIADYKDDIKCLVKIIHCFCENGVFDLTGLKFKTFCCSAVFGDCNNSCSMANEGDERDFVRSDISFKKTTSSLKTAAECNYTNEQERMGINCDIFENNNSSVRFPSKGGLSSSLKNRGSKPSSVKCMPVSFCEDPVCDNSSYRSFDGSYKFDNSVENCPDFIPPINIYFNAENDDTCNCSNYCCECSCLATDGTNNY